MHLRYRTIPSHPSNARSSGSSVTWHSANMDADGTVLNEDVCVSGISFSQSLASRAQPNPHWQTRCTAISTLEITMRDALEVPSLAGLFRALYCMPHLQDLTFHFDEWAPAPGPVELPLLPFRLRRLVLSPVFPGSNNLLRGSSETLETLELGICWGPARAYPELWTIPFASFTALRSLRMGDMPDARILAACARLTALALPNVGESLGLIARHVRHPPTHLTLIYSEFDSDFAADLAWAVAECPVLSQLRALDVETDFGDDLALASCADRRALADVCRARRIRVSVVRTRTIGEWQK
ncbi:hypothetical protein AURDEDRAFT_176072 [Auricularia subglabra TFB-10046 SS5]|nr:hypothetical protein AURDEDRAFT_176072 [Auricularia subglabra TFB-10046 SS5]